MPVIKIENTTLTFKISGFFPDEDEAQVDLKVENRYLNYSKCGHLLQTDEVEEIIQTLNDLLDDKLTKVTTLTFVEPDLTIICYPAKTETREEGLINKRYFHYSIDSHIDFIINFPADGGYSHEKWTVTLSHDKILSLLEGLERETDKRHGMEETLDLAGVTFLGKDEIHWYIDDKQYAIPGQYVVVKIGDGERIALVEYTRTYPLSKLPSPYKNLTRLVRKATEEESEVAKDNRQTYWQNSAKQKT